MDNNFLSNNLQTILSSASKIIECVKTGDGMGLSPEDKEKFVKKMGEPANASIIKEYEKKINELKEMTHANKAKQ